MSDNLRRYQAIRDALKRLSPTEPQGNVARHLNTLAALLSGIVGSKRTHLPAIASKVPDGTKPESRVKRFSRWIVHPDIDQETYFVPYAEALLQRLAHQPLGLVMDGSEVGRGCVTLMVSVVYKNRALPVAWRVVKGTKGHLPQELHVALVEQVHRLMPPGAEVIFLGDGEFDGSALQATLTAYGWHSVCRTAKNILLSHQGEEFPFQQVGVGVGERISLPGVAFTRQAYGPVHAIAWWEEGYQEPLYLITNLASAEEACGWYTKRSRIETFFSDQKSRGFHLHKSHLSDPGRLARLMIAACLAYLWIVYLGNLALGEGWVGIIHRPDRCDLSLVQLGLRLLEHFLNEGRAIPVGFHMVALGSSL